MIGHKGIVRIGGVLYGLVFGSLFTASVYGLWRESHPAVKALVFAVGFVVFYFVGAWAAIRQEQNKKKIPTPSHELRRRRKEFYDWLDSHGRH